MNYPSISAIQLTIIVILIKMQLYTCGLVSHYFSLRFEFFCSFLIISYLLYLTHFMLFYCSFFIKIFILNCGSLKKMHIFF